MSGDFTGSAGACRPTVDHDGRALTVGRLRLRTFPSGARVWIDGDLKVEATPATLLLMGSHHLRIQLPGAESVERDITINAGDNSELDLNLPRPPSATLTILSDVVGAKVGVNGYTRGYTPLLGAVTKPGPVDITLSAPDGRAKSVRTNLAIGEQKRIEVFFSANASISEGSVPDVQSSEPSGRTAFTLGVEPISDVWVDGEDQRRIGRTPLIDYPLEAGAHRLILRSVDGRFEKRVRLEIEAGRTAIFRFHLGPEDAVPPRP